MDLSNKPWDSPKIQMIMSIFNGTVTAVNPMNVMEVKANGEEI